MNQIKNDRSSPSKLLNKEQKYKELNAALEEKTANLINEAESVLRGQDSLFSNYSTSYSQAAPSLEITDDVLDSGSKTDQVREVAVKIKNKKKVPYAPVSTNNFSVTKRQRPTSTALNVKGGGSSGKQKRPLTALQSKNRSHKDTNAEISSFNLIEERATLADCINVLELDAEDEYYTPSNLDAGVLPDVMEDVGSDATIRFLKAKLRVMQEELDSLSNKCKKKSALISNLEGELKEKNESENGLMKKNESLGKIIEKHKSSSQELIKKNTDLESELATLKKDVDQLKKERKQSSAGKNTLEVRLNRALEEAEKHKQALQKYKESTKVTKDSDHKKVEQLQAENRRLDKQKNELLVAFKKQLKLIDILKRQKMHIEAAKLLEFSEEEFMRALDWGKS